MVRQAGFGNPPWTICGKVKRTHYLADDFSLDHAAILAKTSDIPPVDAIGPAVVTAAVSGGIAWRLGCWFTGHFPD